VRFAQETLSPLRGIISHRSTDYDAMLHDTVALIAYEEPEVSNALFYIPSACSQCRHLPHLQCARTLRAMYTASLTLPQLLHVSHVKGHNYL